MIIGPLFSYFLICLIYISNFLYKPILIFQHISRYYEEQKMIATCFLSVFTWHGAGRGPDRFYAWTGALSHLKRKVLNRFSNLYLYKVKFPFPIVFFRDNSFLVFTYKLLL
ncbi:hypothetical protein COM55_25580 [Bacillus pseudomycoides]|nr:hypothetical protein CN590_01040 [Bacillus pseudomycoides]PEL27428.1 hypothetical protein CN608_11875 [Bacillus pseudomycoides]PGE81217.1 hypothetical protein COM55_25580 [Bacillus pseudomycoides]